MSGSGTCEDVCEELGIPCLAFDIHQGFDACDPKNFPGRDVRFHLGSPALLAAEALRRRSPRSVAVADAGAFPPPIRAVHPQLRPIAQTRRQARDPDGRLLRPRGRIRPARLPHEATGLRGRARQHCTDIIRFSHGASSSKKVYRSSFIPGLHDVCMIFEKAN